MTFCASLDILISELHGEKKAQCAGHVVDAGLFESQ